MDKILRLGLLAGALLAGIGIFYHYVIFLPKVEADKAAATERKENNRQLAYSSCISSARMVYDANWKQACESTASSRIQQLKNCLTDKAIIQNQFMGENYCRQTYGQSDSSPDCTLPKGRADALNALHNQAQEKCVAEARLGLE